MKKLKLNKKPRLRVGLLIPDTHAPYHDDPIFRMVLEVGMALGLYYLILLGDFADFYAVSDHSKDPRRRGNIDWEIDQVKDLLKDLDKLGAVDKRYIAGNHEDRLERYLKNNAPALYNMVTIPEVLGLKDTGWKFTPYKKSTAVGKLNMTHDVGTAGRYAVYKCLDAFQESNVTGHTHRFSYIVEGTAMGIHKLSAQFGWLGDVDQIDYMHEVKAKKDWAQGFGVFYHDLDSDLVYVVPVPIVNGTCLVNGKLYKVKPPVLKKKKKPTT